jgi:hypothetical protein
MSFFRTRSVRAARVGRDGLAIRRGQLRRTGSRLARRRTRLTPRLRSSRGSDPVSQRLAALRVTDRPRLIGWSSPDLTNLPVSDASCHRRGHRLVGSMLPTGKLRHRRPCGLRVTLTLEIETAAPSPLAGLRWRGRDAFGRVTSRRELPRGGDERARRSGERRPSRAPSSPRGRRPCASARDAECSSASVRFPRRAFRHVGTSNAKMRRTDFCHSRFYVTVPASRRFPVSRERLHARARSGVIACFTAVQ